MSISDKLQKEHQRLDNLIIQQLLTVLPEDWWNITMEVIRDDVVSTDSGLSVTITNSEGHQDIVMPPEQIYQLVAEHLAIFTKHGTPWASIKYVVDYDDEIEQWRFSIDFAY